MSTSVYLSSSKVQVLKGSGNARGQVHIDEIYDFSSADGLLVNGVVIDGEGFQNAIRSIWEECNLPKDDVKLIVDSSRFRTKKVSIPKVSNKDRAALLKKEFELGEEAEEFICDSMYLGHDEESNLEDYLGIIIDRNYVVEYRDLFEELGIELASISNYLCCGLNGLTCFRQLNEEAYIILSVSGDTINCILMEEGEYVQSIQRRLFTEHGTEEFGVEVAKTVNQMKQFHAGLGSDVLLKKVHLCGFTVEDFAYSKSSIELLELTASKVENSSQVIMPTADNIFLEQDIDANAGDYLASIGNIAEADSRKINFLEVLQNEILEQEKSIRRAKLKKNAPYISVAAVFLIVTVGMLGYRAILNYRIDAANAYLNDATRKTEEARANKIESERKKLNKQLDQVKQAVDDLATYPPADASVANRVASLAGRYNVEVNVASYNSETGILTLQASSSTEGNIHNYIKQLEGENSLFDQVKYSGYTKSDSDNRYNINVSCRMKKLENGGD